MDSGLASESVPLTERYSVEDSFIRITLQGLYCSALALLMLHIGMYVHVLSEASTLQSIDRTSVSADAISIIRLLRITTSHEWDSWVAVSCERANDANRREQQALASNPSLWPATCFACNTKCDLCTCPSNLLIRWPNDMNIYKIAVTVSVMAPFYTLSASLSVCLPVCVCVLVLCIGWG